MSPETSSTQHERRWLILAMVGVAQLMVVLDATIVNIALPSAQRALGFSNDSRQWVVTAYALAFGSLLLIGGRIGDYFGRKRALIAGLIGFALASAMAGSGAELRRARRGARAAGRLRRAAGPVGAVDPHDDFQRSPRSGAGRSASTARSPAAAARSGCCSAVR